MPTPQQPSFDSQCAQQLNDEIKIYRNNPCIIVWSMCNEVFFGQYTAQKKALLTKMVTATHHT